MSSQFKVVVYHKGARDYYSVAEAIQKRSKLKKLLTDYWISNRLFVNIFAKKIGRRYNRMISKNYVISYNFFKIIYFELSKIVIKDKYKTWLFLDKGFTKFVIKKLRKRINKDKKYLFWGFTSGNLEVLEQYKEDKNVLLLHNQIDPGITYYEKLGVTEEEDVQPFLKRLKKEWELSDIILVNSNYSKECLISEGINKKKIIVVPLIWNKGKSKTIKVHNKRLNVLFVGNINSMKGFDTFLDVAKTLYKKNDFLAAGRIHYNTEYIKEASRFVDFRGFVSREEMKLLYTKADLIIFPTKCDGFGMVQLEAMYYGIPVISSSNCANVVINGSNGFICNKAEEIEEKIIFLDKNRDILTNLSNNAFDRVDDYSEEKVMNILNSQLSTFGLKI